MGFRTAGKGRIHRRELQLGCPSAFLGEEEGEGPHGTNGSPGELGTECQGSVVSKSERNITALPTKCRLSQSWGIQGQTDPGDQTSSPEAGKTGRQHETCTAIWEDQGIVGVTRERTGCSRASRKSLYPKACVPLWYKKTVKIIADRARTTSNIP